MRWGVDNRMIGMNGIILHQYLASGGLVRAVLLPSGITLSGERSKVNWVKLTHFSFAKNYEIASWKCEEEYSMLKCPHWIYLSVHCIWKARTGTWEIDLGLQELEYPLSSAEWAGNIEEQSGVGTSCNMLRNTFASLTRFTTIDLIATIAGGDGKISKFNFKVQVNSTLYLFC